MLKEETSPEEGGENLLKKPLTEHPNCLEALLGSPVLCFMHVALQRDIRERE